MDLDRPHFRNTSTSSSSTTTAAAATSELFICFTSRLASSSSMKLTKSILSPGRAARDGAGGGPSSLSSSLSRRLRSNGSLKGGASPFFTTTSRKRGCAFENPEPSSPKVTCIGQVRVKTKKKKAKQQIRSLSKRRSGEVSFRKMEQDGGQQIDDKSQQQRYSNASAHYQQQPPPPECLPHRNQRWVHLPISICEALRAEFSCLFPCKSSCFSASERDQKAAEKNSSGSESGCGAVFARWLVSVNDGVGGKRREIELVVGGGDEAAEQRMSMRSSRRHVFEDIEVKDDRIEVKGQSLEGEEEAAARVSICIPPKNALLLMRCRSDPMKMADLATRFSWDVPDDDDVEEEINLAEENVEEKVEEVVVFEQDAPVLGERIEEEEEEIPDEAEANLEDLCHGEEIFRGEEIQEGELGISNEEIVEEKTEEVQLEILGNEEALVEEDEEEEEEKEEEVESNMSSFEALLVQENAESYEDCPIQDKEEVEDNNICHLSPPTESDEEEDIEEAAAMDKESEASEKSNTTIRETTLVNNDEENQLTSEELQGEEEEEAAALMASTIVKKEKENHQKVLPECLLLMMCEPKLSMEVSKETWVCSTDFIRWLPERPRKPAKPAKAADHEPVVKRRLSIDSKPKTFSLAQPPRSSCSLPAAAAAASMATMIEQKLVNAVAYEPFVLTRCKSEPMRTAAAKLMPESCYWKNAMRKLEPHRRGVGAAGVGF